MYKDRWLFGSKLPKTTQFTEYSTLISFSTKNTKMRNGNVSQVWNIISTALLLALIRIIGLQFYVWWRNIILEQCQSHYCVCRCPDYRSGPGMNTWWRHQMATISALLALCAGNSPVIGEFPAQRPVTRSFDVLFDLRMSKRLSKQSWGWWFETPSRPLWRHSNDTLYAWWYVFSYASPKRCYTSSCAVIAWVSFQYKHNISRYEDRLNFTTGILYW